MTEDQDSRSPIADAPLSVVLFARDVGADLPGLVGEWGRVLAELNRPHEIILVDDGSRDDTHERAELLAREQNALRVLRHDDARGVGAALATGIGAAQYPLVCYAPCDRQFQPAELRLLLDKVDEVDLVTGFRAAKSFPFWLRVFDTFRVWIVRILLGSFPEPRACWFGWPGWRRRWLARWIFGLRIQDPECPFRLFRREIFRRIPIQSEGSLAQIEIMAKANHIGCLMSEAALSWNPDPGTFAEPNHVTPRQQFWRLFRRPDFGPAILCPVLVTPKGAACEAVTPSADGGPVPIDPHH